MFTRMIGAVAGLCALGLLAGGHADATDAQDDAQDDAQQMDRHDADKADHGPHLIKTVSAQDFGATLSALRAAIDERGFKTFAVIDHAAGASSIGEELRPTTLVIFGNPKGGAALVQSAQTVGLALPLKALVYETAEGEVVIAMQDIAHDLAEHGAEDEAARGATIAGVLQALADAAAR